MLFLQIENADFPNIGDFSCDQSLKKASCTFASNQRNLETFGIKKCNALGELCKGFVANQGMKTVTLKHTFYGKNSFAAGMTIFVKKSYISLINITGMFEACPDSLVCLFFFYYSINKMEFRAKTILSRNF